MKTLNQVSFNSTKRFLLLAALVGGLAACSSDNVPHPQPIASDLYNIPVQSQVAILAMKTFDTPKNGVTVVNSGPFQLQDKVYRADGHTLLIPRRSILEGVYTNDGVTCSIAWKNVYPSIVEYKKQRNALPVIEASRTTPCNPERGIKSGDRMIIKFDPS